MIVPNQEALSSVNNFLPKSSVSKFWIAEVTKSLSGIVKVLSGFDITANVIPKPSSNFGFWPFRSQYLLVASKLRLVTWPRTLRVPSPLLW